MNNLVPRTLESNLDYDPSDAEATLAFLRTNHTDRVAVYNAIIGFVARNFGTKAFKAVDLRQSIGFTSTDPLGPTRSQRMTDALHLIVNSKDFRSLFIRINSNLISPGSRKSQYSLTAAAAELYRHTSPTNPSPPVTAVFINGENVSPNPIEVFFEDYIPVVDTANGPDQMAAMLVTPETTEVLTLDRAIEVIHKLYEQNQQYEQTINELYEQNQQLEAQVQNIKGVTVDDKLRSILRSVR